MESLNDAGGSEELAIKVIEKMNELTATKVEVDAFVEHFEKTIPTNGKIIPRQAKTGAKALKKMIKLIEEYEPN